MKVSLCAYEFVYFLIRILPKHFKLRHHGADLNMSRGSFLLARDVVLHKALNFQ